MNATFLQPFLSFTTRTATTFGVHAESTYDWENRQWTVPVNLTVSQLLKLGPQPIQLQRGGRYYAESVRSAAPPGASGSSSRSSS